MSLIIRLLVKGLKSIGIVQLVNGIVNCVVKCLEHLGIYMDGDTWDHAVSNVI